MNRRHDRKASFKRRVSHWADKIGVKPQAVYVQAMRNKWASCSTAGRVYFNSAILRHGDRFQDHVVVHELLHLVVPNHGKLFKSLWLAHLGAQNILLACRRGNAGQGIQD